MIKRSFFMLTPPRLNYDLLEANPREPESIPVPTHLTLLVNQPLDSEKSLLIQKGNAVKKGEKLCLYTDSEEYAISPVSGTINDIDVYLDHFGNQATSIVIETAKTQAGIIADPCELTEEIGSADACLRTLPGAPPLKTLARKDAKINTIVITCTDGDLLSTTNQFLALRHTEDIKAGALLLKKLAGATKVCITVPDQLDIKGSFDGMQVFKISSPYPGHLPAMILKNHLSMELPAGKKPENLGVCFISAEAAAAMANAYQTRTPDFEKIVTIVGKQGSRYRVKAIIGTPLQKIFDVLNIHVNDQDRIVINGPMQGVTTYTLLHPVQPDMDTVIVQDRDTIAEVSDTACVNCGKCVRICPARIPVNVMVRYLAVDQYEEAADKYDLESCIDCGLCAYVCTAKIPIYQYIRLGKYELNKLRADA